MAYGSKRGYKKKFNKKTRYSKSAKGNAYKLDKKIKNLSKKINDEIETKHYSVAITDTAMTVDTGTSTLVTPFNLSSINSGVGVGNRIGEKVVVTSLKLNWQISSNAWGSPSNFVATPIVMYRIIVVRVLGISLTAPTLQQVIEPVTNGYLFNGTYNLDYVGQTMEIVYDKKRVIENNTSKGWFGSINKKMHKKLTFAATTGGPDTSTFGNFYIFFFTNYYVAGADLFPKIRYTSRLNFKDA